MGVRRRQRTSRRWRWWPSESTTAAWRRRELCSKLRRVATANTTRSFVSRAADLFVEFTWLSCCSHLALTSLVANNISCFLLVRSPPTLPCSLHFDFPTSSSQLSPLRESPSCSAPPVCLPSLFAVYAFELMEYDLYGAFGYDGSP